MKNKRVLVLGIVFVLLTLSVGIVFAQGWSPRGSLDGVMWLCIKGRSPRLSNQGPAYYTEVANRNDYAVRVNLTTSDGYTIHRNVDIAAKTTEHFGGELAVTSVVRR